MSNRNLTKRIFSVVLALLMAFSVCLPASAAVADYSKSKIPVNKAESQNMSEDEYAEWKANLLKEEKADSKLKASSYSSGYICNEYIEAYIDSAGQFTMGTVEGDPESDADNYKLLLYGHPDPWSSATLIMIDGSTYWFHHYVTGVRRSDDGLQCTATAYIDGVEINQILTITSNPYTGYEDLVRINYTYKNNGSQAKQVGIRIMLDTMLGSNDGAPFRVNGEDVTYEREYVGNDVPQYWQSFDSLTEPNVTSTGFFYFTEDEKPDKVQFADWRLISGYSSWDYYVDEEEDVTNDSAVVTYFNPRTVGAGGENSVVTYYGVSGFASGNSDLDGELGVRVTAPSELYADENNDGYLNNPFTVTAYLNNLGERTLENVRAVISLADAPELIIDASQVTTVNLGDMYGGASKITKWYIRALPQTEDKTVTYTISFYEGSTLLKTMNMTLDIEGLQEEYIYRTVEFDLNYGEEFEEEEQEAEKPATQYVAIGDYAVQPEETPVRSGYSFGGWYSNPDCTGMPWFNFFNLFKGSEIVEDITLYAKWIEDSQTIVYGEDTFNFINSTGNFFAAEREDYTITGDYYDVLVNELSRAEKTRIFEKMDREWGGSCFGMSSVLALVKAGELSVDFFQGDAEVLYDLEKPALSESSFNLINFYHLMQYTDYTNTTIFDGTSEEDNNRKLIEKLEDSAYPVMVCFYGKAGASTQYGHAVVAYDYQETETGYDVSIWDPNDSEEPNTLSIDTSDWTSSFETTYDTEEINSEIISVVAVEEYIFNYINLQDELINLEQEESEEGTAFRLLSSSGTKTLTLNTNYASFTISDGTSQAVVENGVKTSGELDISDGFFRNEVNEELNVQFTLTGNVGSEYTITPADELDEYFTSISDSDEENGFYVSVTSEDAGEISFGDDGTVSTEYEEDTQQKIISSSNASKAPWYANSVSASSKGLNVSNGESTVISSLSDTDVSVAAAGDYSSVEFDEEALSIGADLELKQSADDERTAVLGDQEQTIGYSVSFITSGGTAIVAQTDIADGEYATEPEDPVRGGFVFAGWYTTANCLDGEEWSFDTPIIEDTTVYAKWLIDNNANHSVTFRAEGQSDIIITVRNGQGISEENIPAVPEKLCCEGMWDISDFSEITSDMVVNAVYNEDHEYGEPVSYVEATCTEDGYYSYECSVCYDEHTDYVDAYGHEMSEYEIETAPSCNASGEAVSSCERDGCEYEETRTVPPTHTDEDLDGICDIEGCGENSSEISLNEQVTFTEEKNVFSVIPTESNALYVDYANNCPEGYVVIYNDKYEEICSEWFYYDDNIYIEDLEAGETYYIEAVPYEAYDYDIVLKLVYCAHENTTYYPVTPGTCSEPGYYEGVKCDDCGMVIWGMWELYGEHEYYWLNAEEEAPTCTEEGNIGIYCENCDYYECRWVPARHTDTEGTGICEICGEASSDISVDEEFTVAYDYYEGSGVYAFIPQQTGFYKFICFDEDENYPYMNLYNELYYYEDCFSGGYTDDAYSYIYHLEKGKVYYVYFSADCECEYDVIVNLLEVPVISFGESYTVEYNRAEDYWTICQFIPEESGTYTIISSGGNDPECELYKGETYIAENDDGGYDMAFKLTKYFEAGETYYLKLRDRVDEGVFDVLISSCSHDYYTEYCEGEAETCNENGHTEGQRCSECNAWITGDTIPATGNHSYNSGAVTKAATCVAAGVKTYTCSVCNGTKTEAIPATGNHSYDSGAVTKAATCVAAGVKTYTCSVCKGTKTEAIPATEKHTSDSGKITTAATYASDGTKTYSCTVCKKVLGTDPVAKLTLAKVTGVAVKNIKTTSVNLTWNGATGAQSYIVYYSTDGKTWSEVKTSTNSATVKKLKAGKEYKFKVVAVNGSAKGAESDILTLTTKPSKINLSSAKAVKTKQVTVTWKKLSGVNGYQVAYSTTKKFTEKTTKTKLIKKAKTTKTTLKKLKSGKKYFVKVRAYKTVNKNKVYGAWSKVKTVKVK